MGRRPLLLLLVLPFALAAPAAGDDYSHKQAVDAELAQLQARMAQSSAREDSLSSSISSATGDIRALEQRVGDVTSRLEALQQDLDLHRTRLAHLNELLQLQTRRLEFLRGQYVTAMQRLDRRIVQLYKQEQPSTLDVVVSSASFSDALDQLDYMRHLGDQDLNASAQVTVARDAMRILRAQTRDTQRGVAAATRIIAIRTAQQLELQNELLARRSGLVAARRSQQQALLSVRSNYRDDASEAAALEKVSSQLAAQIQAAQAAAQHTFSPTASVTQSTPSSSSGFIWPVSGSVVSPFGWRWGRMHEGIDIGVGYGTPIRAAASGTVITAGWEGGYGNLIVIDHGGGLATAYGHQSSFAVGYGSQVSQGQVIGYVGCTGHCFGPHVHFEVRVNGAPVDPLGYL
ncbi:MAG: murein hydrolase activator EnvC family protein [Gaiellaceae bacterium]